MQKIITTVKYFLRNRFNLNEDKGEEKQIIQNIERDVNFKGTNLWTLIFAIMIASIGLNVNSTAVVIGAMLISPLMGPLMGIGLGIGINDFELLKRGVKNLAIAAIISILTSALYFSLTPLHDVNSELLARTNPSLWDVFIAFFGGLAGIVAGTRNQKSNVIPGVAIATALMPPLCTAGFGLATGKWFFLLGALYLFFINSILICLAVFLMVKKLHFHKKQFQTIPLERKVSRYIWTFVIITILPSIYLAYRIVEKTIFESNAKNFVKKEFSFSKTQVVTKYFKMEGQNKSIELLLIGQELPASVIDSLQMRMPLYGLNTTKLIVHQGLNAKQQIDLSEIKASILQDIFSEEKKEDTVATIPQKIDLPIPNIEPELKTLFPAIEAFSLSQTVFNRLDSVGVKDTFTLMTIKTQKLSPSDRIRLQNWVRQRIKSDSVKLLIE